MIYRKHITKIKSCSKVLRESVVDFKKKLENVKEKKIVYSFLLSLKRAQFNLRRATRKSKKASPKQVFLFIIFFSHFVRQTELHWEESEKKKNAKRFLLIANNS